MERRVQGGVVCTADRSGAGACAGTRARCPERNFPVDLASLRMEPLVLPMVNTRRSHVGVTEGGVPGQGAGTLSPCGGVVSAPVLLRARMEGRGSGDAGAGRLAGSTVGCHVLAARLRFCGAVARLRGGPSGAVVRPLRTLRILRRNSRWQVYDVSHQDKAGGRGDA